MPTQPLIYKQEAYAIIGACFEVYNDKGSGFYEEVYHECLELELADQNIPFTTKPSIPLNYKGRTLQKSYTPDLIAYDKIIVELKAETKLAPEHEAQVLNYLKATGFELGLLVNFGSYPKLDWKRIAYTSRPSPPPSLLS